MTRDSNSAVAILLLICFMPEERIFRVAGMIIFLVAASVAGGCVHAQVAYGFKGGLNLSDVVINNIVDPDFESDYAIKPGVHAGFFLYADFEDDTGLAVELLYSDKGVRAINDIHFHYIAVPILARYEVAANLFLEGGPELAYLFSARSKYGNLNHIWDNQTDLGLDVGVQYFSKLVVGIRFNAGVSSVIRNAYGANGERIRYQNRVLQITVGYRLGTID